MWDLDGALLVQCTVPEAAAAAPLADGLVLTGPRAVASSLELRASGFTRPVLCDAAAYAGTRRKPARAPFDNRWLSWQLSRGYALTDSGYVDKLDIRGLNSILHRTMRLGPGAIALLPLHADWLRMPSDREILLSSVAFAEVPVAVAIEHVADPLGVRAVVSGLLELLALDVPVVLLRSDVSALGALCSGAVAAAVGTSTSLRHIYPVVTGGGFRAARVAAFSPHLLSYVSVDKLASAVQLTPDLSHLWECTCTTCNGRPLDWLATQGSNVPAFRHSLEHLRLLRDDLFTVDAPARPLAWFERCNAALALHYEIRTELPDWRTPAFLNAWRYASTPSVSSRS
ncbi:hypothetical protein FKR81_09440 [Lentzea tibetensis]|uniref:Uncharacterized protein n=1 Tax=Lentzea tibetensis TaxID=2591470 RepID=A0A563EXW5_9PSEU|nr:hypothetical protein [Lentzea tibetensis]TWP52536.1 hypothetical protein FKR81_09440 [Lentzea tibetensis]